MGVLNVTPDSFSDGGHHLSPERAVARAREMVEEGARVIDVGGESTRPGAVPVPAHEELRRVVPVIEALASELVPDGARVSIDTRKPAVARAAVAAGATLVNDVSASLWETAAELGVGWVAMHARGDPATMQDDPRYGDVVAEVVGFLEQRASVAVRAGVEEVWVDPGIGFGKTLEHNLALLAHLDALVATGFPVLVGASRKSSLARLLGEADLAGRPGVAPEIPGVQDRLEGSIAAAVWAVDRGARMVRAHDVLATTQALAVVG